MLVTVQSYRKLGKTLSKKKKKSQEKAFFLYCVIFKSIEVFMQPGLIDHVFHISL